MAQVRNELLLTDLVLLKLIMDNPCLHKHELWSPTGGLWNKTLKPLVDAGHCGYVTADRRFASAIETLRFCGLLHNEPPYRATEAATTLFYTLQKSMKRWPLILPLNEDGSRDFDHAQYFEKK